jgi:CubicO group peptidase (beta-lactamase class C family)
MKNLFLFLIVLTNYASAQINVTPETIAKIKEVESNITGPIIINNEKPNTIEERMAKYKIKGLSIAVIHNYKLVWAKGYGWANEAEKKPVTINTLFEPGSISKTLNAVGILKLAQDKKLDLNTDINTYLSSWKFPYDSLSKGKKITLTHILTHHAGLSVHGFPGHDLKGPIPTIYEVLDGKQPSFTPAVRSEFEPDLKYQYAGGGTSISQVILTDITKQAYDVWMYDNVLKPIGMVNSTYAQPPSKEIQLLCASAYNRDGTAIQNRFHVYPEQAAAGLWMTPSDLANYIIDMQLAYKGNASKVLNAEMVKLHLTPYRNSEAAMGTFIQELDGAKYFEHSAGNDGFCGEFIGSLEDGNGVVIFLNTDNFKIIPEIVNSVAKAYQWKNYYREPQQKNSIVVADSVIKSYEGVYLFDNQFAVIGKSNNAYHFYTDGIRANMHFTSNNCFFNEEFQAVKEFIKDNNGKVIGYKRTVNGKEFPMAVKLTNVDTLSKPALLVANIGWYYFEEKNFKEAVPYFIKASQVDSSDINNFLNLGHAYLFNNETDKAIETYKKYLKQWVKPGLSFEDLLKQDYIYFREHQYNVQMFDQVFKTLNVPKPNN